MLFVRRTSLIALSFVWVVLIAGCGKGKQSRLSGPNLNAHASTAPVLDAETERLLAMSPDERLSALKRRFQDELARRKGVSYLGPNSEFHKVETGADKENLQVVMKDGGYTGEWTLSFLELLQGDIDLNGYVGDPGQNSADADLAELGLRLGHYDGQGGTWWPDDPDVDRVSTRDNAITIAEISSIAENFHVQISRYDVYFIPYENPLSEVLIDQWMLEEYAPNVPPNPPPHWYRIKWEGDYSYADLKAMIGREVNISDRIAVKPVGILGDGTEVEGPLSEGIALPLNFPNRAPVITSFNANPTATPVRFTASASISAICQIRRSCTDGCPHNSGILSAQFCSYSLDTTEIPRSVLHQVPFALDEFAHPQEGAETTPYNVPSFCAIIHKLRAKV